MSDDRLAKYLEEDAERWIAVHERIRGLTILLIAVTDAAIERDASLRLRIIGRLQEVLLLYATDQGHPALLAEIREFVAGLEGEDPTHRSIPPARDDEPS